MIHNKFEYILSQGRSVQNGARRHVPPSPRGGRALEKKGTATEDQLNASTHKMYFTY